MLRSAWPQYMVQHASLAGAKSSRAMSQSKASRDLPFPLAVPIPVTLAGALKSVSRARAGFGSSLGYRYRDAAGKAVHSKIGRL